MTVPLIWTTKGNLPVSDLRRETEWRVSEKVFVFIERYYLGDELVKESSHVKLLDGAEMNAGVGKIGE
jgi:hypothetical protein